MIELTGEQQAFRELVRDYVRNEITPHVDAWEAAGRMPLHDVFADMSRHGLLGVEHARENGGQGADSHAFTVILAEELGRCGNGAFPMAYGVQTDMATPSLARFGTSEQRDAYLAPALRGEMVASIAVTEPDAGSDVASIRTRAVRDGNHWRIRGAKTYITNGLQADWLCLLARTSEEGGHAGMSQIIVPTRLPDGHLVDGLQLSPLDKLGMRASDTAVAMLDDVRVPIANTIGVVGRGFQQQMQQFVIERTWVVYSAVGACTEAIERTREYARQRHLFGSPLIDNQVVAYRLADLAAEIDLLRVYAYTIAARRDAGLDTTRMATIAKLKAGRLTREVAEWCLQFHGGLGFMEETWTARFLRDQLLVGIGGGSNETMQRVLTGTDGFRR